jgi:hypothetical protein
LSDKKKGRGGGLLLLLMEHQVNMIYGASCETVLFQGFTKTLTMSPSISHRCITDDMIGDALTVFTVIGGDTGVNRRKPAMTSRDGN